ncbi:dTDP-4-dehydrorhamnose reductase [Flavobacteriaceae bacterium Ap0902]|nr:dTDP-4-dehydrorhamnose reductase [Flavobacteriaceae bacterium Ap0902]
MMNVLVTGGNGQLAMCLRDASKQLDDKKYHFTFISKDELNITNSVLVYNYLAEHPIDLVVNCAAYTQVDKAEENEDMAYRVNADAVQILAQETSAIGAGFIHISTDYVFNGEGDIPFSEEDVTDPRNVYGASKLKGEKFALENNPEAIIIRTAWVYSQYGNNFLKTMLRLFKTKEEISVVDDQLGTPTNANDIARAIIQIIISDNHFPGLYHFTNSGMASWYDFATKIKAFTGSSIKINPIPTSAYPTLAKRPHYSVLNTAKIQSTFGIEVPEWKESLRGLIDMELIA